MNTTIMLVIALVPAIALMIFIYFQDNHEKEPISLLLKIFGLGILSAIPASILEKLIGGVIDVTFGGTYLLYYAVTAFFGVAIIEEGVKFGAAYFLTWRNKHFNYKFDGIVYCLFGSMGFAGIENVLYVFISGADNALRTGVQRALLAIPAHAMCSIFMGYYYGNAKYLKSYGDRLGCKRNLITGFLIACSLHAYYDFCLFTQNPFFIISFYIFVIVADIFTIIRIHKAKKENQKMYEAPQYRQYWAGPAANPYELYGGYAAPTYGGYGTAANPQVVAQNNYNPQVAAQNAYNPQVTAQSAYNPQGTTQNAYAPQGMNYGQQAQFAQQGQYGQNQFAQQASQYNQPNQQAQYSQQTAQFTQPDQYNEQGGNVSHTPLEFNEEAANLQRREFQQPQYENNAAGQQTQASIYQTPGIRERMLKCPVCGTVVSFNAFYCKSCGASIHQL